MSAYHSRRLARLVAGTSMALTGLGFSLSVIFVIRSGDLQPVLSHQALVPVSTVIYALLGGLITSRHPRNAVGWIFAAVGLLYGLNALAVGYANYSSLATVGVLPSLAIIAKWLGNWVWLPNIVIPTTFVYLLFPDGRLLSRGWSAVGWAVALGLAAVMIAMMFAPYPVESAAQTEPNPYEIEGAAGALNVALQGGYVLLGFGWLGSVASALVRFRRSHGTQREQMKWLIYGLGLMALAFVFGNLAWVAWPDATVATELSIVMTNLSVLMIAVAAGIAILRHRLYDIDLLINRTLVYGALTTSVVGLYVLVVGGSGVVFQSNRGLASLLVTAVLAGVVYRPLRGVLQRGADRIVPDLAYAPAEVAESPGRKGGSPAADASPAMPGLKEGSAWARLLKIIWVLVVGGSVLIFLISLPGYLIGLGEGPPDMVAQVEPVAEYVFAVDVLNAIASVAGALLSFGLAALLYRRKPDQPMALFVSMYLMVYAVVILGPLEEAIRFLPLSLETALAIEAGVIAVPTMMLLFMFPNGEFVPRWSRWLVLATLVLLPLTVATPPVASQASPGLTALGVLWWAILSAAGIGSQVHRYRMVSTPAERQQTKVAVAGLILWIGSLTILGIIYALRQRVPATEVMPWWGPASELAWFLSLNILPVSLALAVMRHRLWDINFILNRAIVYVALTASVVGLYVLVVGAAGMLFQERGGLIVSLFATGLVAVVFQPLRERLQKGVNRLLYGDRDDPYRVLSRLSRRLEATLAPEAVLPTIVETVAQALKLPYTAIAIREGEAYRVASSYGLPRGESHRLALTYQGEVVGRLECAARGPNSPFTPEEHNLLEAVAAQAGVAVHATRLTQDLRRSRERLIVAREEERRRLRRDLHDGLGPELASVTLKLDAARNLLHANPGEVESLLSELKGQVQEALADVRRLVYGLRPPALDELGLVEAVRQATQIHDGFAGPRVFVEAPDELPPLPAAVEVAAYRIALEAVTNAARHAHASTCRVGFSCSDWLKIQVSDDGRGMPEKLVPGVGLTSMRERAQELGGSLQMEHSSNGGTTVVARIPLSGMNGE